MLNKALLVGNLTKDPVFSKTQSGLSFVRFTLACNRTFSKNNEADFISCIAWRQTADFMSQYVKKGNTVAIDGRITTGSYDDKDGKKVYTTDVTCDSVQLIVGSKREQEQPSDQPQTWQSKAKEEKKFESTSWDTGEPINIDSSDLPF